MRQVGNENFGISETAGNKINKLSIHNSAETLLRRAISDEELRCGHVVVIEQLLHRVPSIDGLKVRKGQFAAILGGGSILPSKRWVSSNFSRFHSSASLSTRSPRSERSR